MPVLGAPAPQDLPPERGNDQKKARWPKPARVGRNHRWVPPYVSGLLHPMRRITSLYPPYARVGATNFPVRGKREHVGQGFPNRSLGTSATPSHKKPDSLNRLAFCDTVNTSIHRGEQYGDVNPPRAGNRAAP